jgi:ribosomal protein S18 acetylase RimI-like enzyme
MRSVTVMDDAALRRLARRVTAPGATAPLGVYLMRANDPASELARHVERVVFMETFGNTPELLDKEYAPYDEASIFICVVDHLRAVPAGTMRILLPSPAGFKTLDDAAPVWGESIGAMAARTGIDIDLTRTWDIATLAVAPEYRGKATMGLVSMGLYQALALATPRCGIEWLLAILDVPVFRMIRWKLRMPMAGFTGVRAEPYLGSPASMPVWCNVGDTERRLAVSDPDLHALYFEGVGMEPAVAPLDLRGAVDLGAPRFPTRVSPGARPRSVSTAS